MATATTAPSSSSSSRHVGNSNSMATVTQYPVPGPTVTPLNLETLIQSLPACQRCRECRRGCDTLLPKCRFVQPMSCHTLQQLTSCSSQTMHQGWCQLHVQ
ncbi:unnamed protein product [Periconia digitata]|uniref:Uncharacterized protein n=1 Tax=Periconia digitata TaxID=1303443 RepID=A0A9W4UDS0_9PLEO|nr:unnamed protein product [Periconia digitata]